MAVPLSVRIAQTSAEVARSNSLRVSVRILSTANHSENCHKVHDDESTSSARFNGDIPTDGIKKSFSLSSGPGGQHVGKVATKAEIRFSLTEAKWIPQNVKECFARKYARYTNSKQEQEVVISSQQTRDATQNLDDCFHKLRAALDDCCRELALRRDPNASDERILRQREEKAAHFRLQNKLRHSVKKRERSQVF